VLNNFLTKLPALATKTANKIGKRKIHEQKLGNTYLTLLLNLASKFLAVMAG